MLRILLVAALAATAMAQGRTFVVDAANGPGTDFTDLPPAMAQAQHGDVYLVRAGAYSPTAVTKGVRLLGQGRPTIGPGVGMFSDALFVTNVPAGETFAMRGIDVRHADQASGGMECNSIHGHVHFEDVGFYFTSTTNDPGATIDIQACPEVTFTRCRSHGYARLANAEVWFVDCHLRGNDETPNLGAHPAIVHVIGGIGAMFSLAGGTYVGGNSTRIQEAVPGMVLTFGTMVLTGDASTTIQAGTGPSGTSAGAILAADCTILLEPSLTLIPSGGAQPIVEWRRGTVRLQRRPLACLTTSPATLGARLQGTLRASVGDTFLLACSLAHDAFTYHDWRLLVDLQSHVGLGYGVMTATTFSFNVQVPNDLSLRGAPFAFQAGVFHAATSELGLSNAALVVVSQ